MTQFDVLITSNRWNDSPIQASVQDASLHLKEWVSEQSQDKRVVFAIKAAQTDEVGWQLQVKAWNPETYQGRPFPKKILSYVPSLLSWKNSEWTRGSASGRLEAMDDTFDKWLSQIDSEDFIAEAFGAMFHVLMNAQVPTLLVESLGHSIAVGAFCENVHSNIALKRIEFDSLKDLAANCLDLLPKNLHRKYMQLSEERQKRFDKQWLTRLNANRNAELCVALVRSDQPKSWRELVFLNMGACTKGTIRKLLEAMRDHDTLDFRTERRIQGKVELAKDRSFESSWLVDSKEALPRAVAA